ncbi:MULTISPECIES: HAD family hydrolase [Brachybacterium]|uniref:HAD family hydrolase n=1 Tax=Brachybacterium TaxID=43668 RepID=UPI000BB69617|nr:MULTISPECIES: HAD family phosphatase [Brachybacterium]PCC32996.1 haloacid dehalogenase [Brachybacterium alimentarium]RCS58943.1 HAD family phosphatase [Brachybacterium sp. JB7]RCS67627.1 HAD family phosphatase [Brachybacterium alimentarium]RCS76849.1 HAD family phosphatase [Brachybacterium alimentarium]RCS81436.1 HAD family phosphatase [Brachybacterium alimentarium]
MSTDTSPLPLPPSPLDTWPPAWTPAAAIFDCDGLLVDTEGHWVALQDRYLARHGATLDPATRRAITGRAVETVVVTIGEAVGKDPYAVGEELLEEHRQTLGGEIAPIPGALETLRAVAAVRPVAVASNSPRDLLDTTLASLGITDLIDASVSVEDVATPKPAPDMYLTAAAALGADPADCLGFEDSETGAEAALAAGLQLIAVPSIPGQEPRAPRRLDSLADPVLTSWIAGWESLR